MLHYLIAIIKIYFNLCVLRPGIFSQSWMGFPFVAVTKPEHQVFISLLYSMFWLNIKLGAAVKIGSTDIVLVSENEKQTQMAVLGFVQLRSSNKTSLVILALDRITLRSVGAENMQA